MDWCRETLPGGTVVFADKAHPITTDSLLLARFCDARAGWAACDLGSGGGILLLSLLDAGLRGPAVGVELEAGGVAMLDAALRENGFAQGSAVQADLREYRDGRLYDLVVANPPYFNQGAKAPNPVRAAARHDESCTPAQLCAAAARLLKDGGRFCLCWPPARLAVMLTELQAHRLAPKRMQFVRKAPAAAPWLVLLDARKAGGEGLTVLPDQILPPGEPLEY